MSPKYLERRESRILTVNPDIFLTTACERLIFWSSCTSCLANLQVATEIDTNILEYALTLQGPLQAFSSNHLALNLLY